MKILAILASAVTMGFMAVVETVLVATDNGPVRVNKSDFDADQLKDAKDRQFKPYTGKETAEQSINGQQINAQGDNPPIAAPSAPHFGGPDGTDKPRVDPLKQAAAPTMPSENQRLVMKDGGKFYVVDGVGNKLKADDGVEADGYKTEALAWKAIKDLPH